MRVLFLCACLSALSLPVVARQQAPPPPAIKVGQQAPDFTLHYLAKTADGKYEQKTVSLGEFKGQKSVILAFFPAAFSPGWTKELSLYRDNASQVTAAAAQVVGVSVDSVWANKAFADLLKLDFPLLSDPKHDVARAYGVYDEANGVARRTTFVIDPTGVVRHIDQSSEAIDPNGAIGACPVPKKK